MSRLAYVLGLEAVAVTIAYLALRPDLPHTIMSLLAVVAVTVLVLGLPEGRTPTWPRRPPDTRDGTRDDISALSWSFLSRDNTVSTRAVTAAHDAATRRLALHGVDLTDPDQHDDARALLGPEAHDLLTRATHAPTMRQLRRTIDTLVALEPPTAPAHPTQRTPR